MDQKNTFDTPATAWLHRAEYGVALAICSGLFLANWGEIRWLPAIVLFLYIDLIGYLPGAIAYRRSRNGRVSRVYYVLYNSTHSLLSAGLVVALWAWLIGPEWALLAVPIHLFGDRALFGNQLKPFGVPFEPKRLASFDTLLREVRTAGSADPQATAPPPEPGRQPARTG
jgi:hypothetical protein